MAIFHLSTNTISRKSGRTSVAAAAYRCGAILHDQRTGKTHDFTRKKGVVFSDCFMFNNGEKIELDRVQLWNKAEQSEKRADARTAREIIVNLPHELDEQQRQNLVEEFSENLAKKYQIAIDYAIHLPNEKGDDRNHHAHILMTTRQAALAENGFYLGEKTSLELSNTKLQKLGLPRTQDQIKAIRESWAELTNLHLKNAGIEETIDHRSYAEQGSDQMPTQKMGYGATQLERDGIKTEKGDYNRTIAKYNETLAELIEYETQRDEQNITANTNAIEGIDREIAVSKQATYRAEQASDYTESEVRIESDRYDSTEQSIKHRERKFSELASRYASTKRAISTAFEHRSIATENHLDPKMAALTCELFPLGVEILDRNNKKSIVKFSDLFEKLNKKEVIRGASLQTLNPYTNRVQDVNNFDMSETYKRVYQTAIKDKIGLNSSAFVDYNTLTAHEFFTKYKLDSSSENAQKDIAERYSKIAPPDQQTTTAQQEKAAQQQAQAEQLARMKPKP